MTPSALTHMGPLVVLGLGFGDEGKGISVASLARKQETKLVIRFNGGSQAAHHVVREDGLVHCFSQFGSATLGKGRYSRVRTHLSQHVVVDPAGIELEAAALEKLGVEEPMRLISVDDKAILTTPWHKWVNRAKELARGGGNHGSCGKGIGEAWLDQQAGLPGVTWGQLGSLRFGRGEGLKRALREIRDLKMEKLRQPELWATLSDEQRALAENSMSKEYLSELAAHYQHIASECSYIDGSAPWHPNGFPFPDEIIFEGAQGALLDADLGFFPHVTPSFTGARNALEICKEQGWPEPFVVGVLRAYSSRHGAGPFVVEDPGLLEFLPDLHNETGRFQGPMRVGWFDAVAARYGIQVAGKVDGLMITHLDRIVDWPQIGVCDSWMLPPAPEDLPSGGVRVAASGALVDLPKLEGTLEQRTRWSAWLTQAQPNILIRDGREQEKFLDWIRVELELPILGRSFGPMVGQQEWA